MPKKIHSEPHMPRLLAHPVLLILILAGSLSTAANGDWVDPHVQPALPQIPDRSFNLQDFGNQAPTSFADYDLPDSM
jgi:hypothetical protein